MPSCRNWNVRECRSTQCQYQHSCLNCGSNHKATRCTSAASGLAHQARNPPYGPEAAASVHGLTKRHAHSPSPPRVVTLEPQTLPNTSLHYALYTAHTTPMPAGILRPQWWEQLTKVFPNHQVVLAIPGICQYRARIGYEGHRSSITIHPNLTTAELDSNIVTADIISEQIKNRLECYQNLKSLPARFTASPLGLTDKADGTKRRIHHLSYPPGDPTAINNGIPEEYGAIAYSTIDDAIEAIQHFRKKCIMVKRDFEAAFRHIPVSPLDTPLLGFPWGGRYYAERFLPFGL